MDTGKPTVNNAFNHEASSHAEKHSADNERIKRRYFEYLKDAKGQSEQTVDVTAKALARFEKYTKWRSFKAFHYQQAVAFKNHLANENGQQSGQKLSKATLNATLANLKRFFQWLSDKPGYKSRLQYTNADYFSLSDNDVRVAKAKRDQKAPTVEQVRHLIAMMPRGSEVERHNRALVAFTLLTGARDMAIASIKLKHIDLQAGCIVQDARDVRTKFSKTVTTYFFPVEDWVLLGERICRSPEQFKAWSQTLGHEKVLTTFFSYGVVSPGRQGEIIQILANQPTETLMTPDVQALARALRIAMKDCASSDQATRTTL